MNRATDPGRPEADGGPREAEGCPEAGRRPYLPPRLEVLGDLRDLTMGPSPGIGDSAGSQNRQPPGLQF